MNVIAFVLVLFNVLYFRLKEQESTIYLGTATKIFDNCFHTNFFLLLAILIVNNSWYGVILFMLLLVVSFFLSTIIISILRPNDWGKPYYEYPKNHLVFMNFMGFIKVTMIISTVIISVLILSKLL